MNSNLYNTSSGEVVIPNDIKQHLRNSFAQMKTAPENTEGYKRNQELQNQEKITYKQLKRIKNFFDNYQGKPNDPSFILNGGVLMRTWVNNTLNNMRNNTTNNQQQAAPFNGNCPFNPSTPSHKPYTPLPSLPSNDQSITRTPVPFRAIEIMRNADEKDGMNC